MADITNFIDRVSDETAQSFMAKIDEMGVSIDDRRIEDFLAQIDLIDELYKNRTEETNAAIAAALAKGSTTASISVADISKALETAIGTQALVTDYPRLTRIIEDALLNDQLIHQQVPQNQLFGFNQQVLMGGILSFGLIVGMGAMGLFSNFVWLPQQVEASRLQRVEDFKYLNSKEGKFFRELVKLNSGYLDTGKCREYAAKYGYYLSREKEKITNVCLVMMPKN